MSGFRTLYLYLRLFPPSRDSHRHPESTPYASWSVINSNRTTFRRKLELAHTRHSLRSENSQSHNGCIFAFKLVQGSPDSEARASSCRTTDARHRRTFPPLLTWRGRQVPSEHRQPVQDRHAAILRTHRRLRRFEGFSEWYVDRLFLTALQIPLTVIAQWLYRPSTHTDAV